MKSIKNVIVTDILNKYGSNSHLQQTMKTVDMNLRSYISSELYYTTNHYSFKHNIEISV